ncbi:MAG: carboxypeptidase-like regulatory domain-containing protein [Terriglobales bacterium]
MLLGQGLAAAATPAQYAAPYHPKMAYAEQASPARARLPLPRIRGQITDRAGNAVPQVELGLYTDAAPHKLLALALSDDHGKFDFGGAIPSGNYRLIAMYPGLCTANVPLELNRNARRRSLALRMEYPGLDVCSHATLK